MKKALLLFLTCAALMNCSDEVLDNLDLPEMNAKVDGTEWKTSIRASRLENDKFIVTGTSIAGEILAITIFGSSEGIYELSLTQAKCAALLKESVNSTTEDAYASVTGKVTLTDVNTSTKKISGTFEFVLLRSLSGETVHVTEGVFKNLTYTVESE